MRISDWSSDVCSSDLDGERNTPARSPVPEVTDAEFDAKVVEIVRVAAELADYCRANQTRAVVVVVASGAPKATESTKNRTRVVAGKSVYVRGDLWGRRIIEKKKITQTNPKYM